MMQRNAREVVNGGALGDVRPIRALWPRNFTWDWRPPDARKPLATGVKQPDKRDGWFPPIYEMDAEALRKDPALWNKEYDSIEQLIRWRVFDKTGGGLMAELGSHQLDASSIFLGKVKPLSVSGVGG